MEFAHADWLGTERVRSAIGGGVVSGSQWTSLPFGEGSAAPNPSPLHFTGKERDTESGLDYFGARYYASSMGRFLNPDWSAKVESVPYAKLDNPQSLNLYAYMKNNPLGSVDPDGHCCWDYVVDAAQQVFGTAVQLFNDGMHRSAYKAAASQLSGPGASAARKSLQASTYDKLSPIGKSITDDAKASRVNQLANKTAEQLTESASRTNPGINALGNASKVIGEVGVVAAVGSVVVDTANAPNGQKLQTAVDDSAGLGGSWGGAELGGMVGAEAGPWGALGGSILGGIFGETAVKNLMTKGAGDLRPAMIT